MPMPCPQSEDDWEAAGGFLEMLDEDRNGNVTWNETKRFWERECGGRGPPSQAPGHGPPRGPTYYADEAY